MNSMRGRVAVLAGVLAAFAVQHLWRTHARREKPVEPALALAVPEALGPYRAVEQWNNRLEGGVIERGAAYAEPGSDARDAVVFDFFLNRRTRHNGALCYLYQGESLRWERKHTVSIDQRPVSFDLALLNADGGLRLAASTECSDTGCNGDSLPFWDTEHQRLNLRVLLAPLELYQRAPADAIPVMLSIRLPLTVPAGAVGEADSERALLQTFDTLAPQLRLGSLSSLAMQSQPPSPP
jgi:hypothetical protein